jgi:hypothetical protein
MCLAEKIKCPCEAINVGRFLYRSMPNSSWTVMKGHVPVFRRKYRCQGNEILGINSSKKIFVLLNDLEYQTLSKQS